MEYKEFFEGLKKGEGNMIVIDGTVGCGKSSLAKILGEELGIEVQYEPVVDNPILDKFYYDRSRYSFPLQVFFLNKRFEMIKKAEGTIVDRGIYGDMIFAKMLHDNGEMTTEEFGIYCELAQNMLEHVAPPRLMIYLKTTVDDAVRKIGIRGRDYEQIVERDYWERLNAEYVKFFDEYNLGKLLVIDVSGLDFVNNETERKEVIRRVLGAL